MWRCWVTGVCEAISKWIFYPILHYYNQTTGKLKSVDGSYCCLGVLCDIYHNETGLGKWEKTYDISDIQLTYNVDVFDCGGLLPTSVMMWADLNGRDPKLKNGRFISYTNDRGATFNEISNLIETDL